MANFYKTDLVPKSQLTSIPAVGNTLTLVSPFNGQQENVTVLKVDVGNVMKDPIGNDVVPVTLTLEVN